MKKLIATILVSFLSLFFVSWKGSTEEVLAKGSEPEISLDGKGAVRIVYGRADSIFCLTSTDKGVHFSQPVLVAYVPQMHLGMTRGPQIASSLHYSVITAMDKKGTIHWFLLDHGTGKWQEKGAVNDLPNSAPEGLMGLAADGNDHFYAVWLDTRIGKRNNIFFSSLSAATGKWSKNALVYKSPEGHTCECCKPNIAVQGAHIAIMFRNWLNGSRDLYLAQSANGGRSFQPAQKLGIGTWKLNGCPMDGGGVTIDDKGKVWTVWQRQGIIYSCTPGESEAEVGKGRACGIASIKGHAFCFYQSGEELKVSEIANRNEQTTVGKGGFLRMAMLPDETGIYTWEDGGNIMIRRIG